MWDCPKCSEQIEESFQVCWNCGTSKDGREDPDFQPEGTPEDRAGPREDAESVGRSRPRACLLAGAVYGFVVAFMPRPTEFQEDPFEEIVGDLPLWGSACLLVLTFGVGVLMGIVIHRLMMVDRAPVRMLKSGPSWFKAVINLERRLIVVKPRIKLLKSGPSWFKTLLTFDWPPHWWENTFWACVGAGVGISISAPFVGMWALFRGVLGLITVAGMSLGFRLSAQRLDDADGKRAE